MQQRPSFFSDSLASESPHQSRPFSPVCSLRSETNLRDLRPLSSHHSGYITRCDSETSLDESVWVCVCLHFLPWVQVASFCGSKVPHQSSLTALLGSETSRDIYKPSFLLCNEWHWFTLHEKVVYQNCREWLKWNFEQVLKSYEWSSERGATVTSGCTWGEWRHDSHQSHMEKYKQLLNIWRNGATS